VADDAEAPVTEADVRALAAKLKGLHALLSPAEQAQLHAALRRAAGCRSEPADVEGAAWAVRFNPFPYLDAIAAEDMRAGTAAAHDGSWVTPNR
jgi:hypothetical protein